VESLCGGLCYIQKIILLPNAGVLLAFHNSVFCDGEQDSIFKLEEHYDRLDFLFFHLLLANTAIIVSSDMGETLAQHYSIGIALGLIVGKPGIFLFFSLLAVKLGFTQLRRLNWKQ
jgi:NhaA family Na+:H+ antiporter